MKGRMAHQVHLRHRPVRKKSRLDLDYESLFRSDTPMDHELLKTQLNDNDNGIIILLKSQTLIIQNQ